MSNNDLRVTSLEDLKTYSEGKVVKLPNFAEGQPFVARLRRASMMKLMESGVIPNGLLKIANDLFEGKTGSSEINDAQTIADTFKVSKLVVGACLISPSIEEIEEAGLSLTDEQVIAIFNYSQRGIEALKPFRKEQKNPSNNRNGKAVPYKTK